MSKNSSAVILQGIIILLIIIAIAWIGLAPYFLTKNGPIDFRQTGQIGDTIGGITAPAIGLLSALLLYFSFNAQVKANRQINKQLKKSHQETNFIYINDDLKALQTKQEIFKYVSDVGIDAIKQVNKDIGEILVTKKKSSRILPSGYVDLQIRIIQGLENLNKLVVDHLFIVAEIESLKLSKEHRSLLKTKYYVFYSGTIGSEFSKWKNFEKLEAQGFDNKVTIRSFNKSLEYVQKLLESVNSIVVNEENQI